jgi:hypothetical protein
MQFSNFWSNIRYEFKPTSTVAHWKIIEAKNLKFYLQYISENNLEIIRIRVDNYPLSTCAHHLALDRLSEYLWSCNSTSGGDARRWYSLPSSIVVSIVYLSGKRAEDDQPTTISSFVVDSSTHCRQFLPRIIIPSNYCQFHLKMDW